MNDLYVAGTDTGVGKTVLSLLLMQFFLREGRRPFYLKPLQTGCRTPRDKDSDAAFVYRHTAALRDRDPGESVICCFANPKAPWFAARDEGRTVDLKHVEEVIEEKSRRFDPLIIEAAGGVLVPVAEGTLIADTIRQTGAGVLLAARAGLGTINHTLLSLEALQARGITPRAVVFLDAAETAPEMIAENKEAIETYSGVKVAGVIGRIADFSRPPEESYRPFEFLLREGLV